ncbi:amidohydrolase family protein, partial [Bacillus rubiinfantis]|uniref:amidohydrolase family protein n=1 Tax=Bacillus rubiinfantis TaxID=1499680 RepID=UPI0005A72CD1
VTRRKPSETHQGWNPAEKLTLLEAVKLFTIGGAYAANQERVKGTLSVGKWADMTVFSKNLFALESADEILQTSIEVTIIDGKIQEG